MIYRSFYINKIWLFTDKPFIKIITGVRRCGKTTILKMLMEKLINEKGVDEKQIVSYSFDSIEYDGMSAKDLFTMLKSQLVEGKKTYFFLDEVQEIDNWERGVNTLFSDFDTDIYVTGSNSWMMSSEIATYLTGRYISFKIFTLSFAEFLTFKSSYTSLQDTRLEFQNYMKQGGFPAVHLQQSDQDFIYTIVKDIYNSTIFSDIVKRHRIRNVDLLERLVRFIFSNVGNAFSAKTITDYLKAQMRSANAETVYGYLKSLEQAYLIHRCLRYDLQGKEILKTQEKFFLADISLRYAVLGYNLDSVASSLENIIYLELIRRGYDVYVGKDGTYEIDFVAVRGNDKLYIQVTQEMQSEETRQREYGRLLKIKDNYPKYVLCTDMYAAGNHKGIKTMHVADFLLSDEF